MKTQPIKLRVGNLFPSKANSLTLEDRLNKYLPKNMIDSSHDYCVKVLACSNFNDIKQVLNKVELSFYLEYQDWFLSQLAISNVNYDQKIMYSYEFYSKVRTIPSKVLGSYLPDLGLIESLAQQQEIEDLNYVIDFIAFYLFQDSNPFLDLAYQYFEELVSSFEDSDYMGVIIESERLKLALKLEHYYLEYLKKYHRKQYFLSKIEATRYCYQSMAMNEKLKEKYLSHRVGYAIEPVKRRY